MCCERCHARAAPLASREARRYRAPKAPTPPAPGRYAQLLADVLGALQRGGEAATGNPWAIAGLGDSDGRFIGYCPVCARGLLRFQLFQTDPPRARTEGCDNGCAPDLIYDVLWPPET